MPSETVRELKMLLRNKFPQAHLTRPGEDGASGGFDFSDPRAFPVGTISEIIPGGPEPILGLLLASILGEPPVTSLFPDFVLVDGDRFDPNSFPPNACSRLLWVRCGDVAAVMKSADLLIRDANIPFILLDACHFPHSALRGLPSSQWWRLKQMAERSACRVLVLSPFPLVPCASLRLSLSSSLTLADFDRPRAELREEIHVQPTRMRQAT